MNNDELENYLERLEFNWLTSHKKNVMRRFCKIYGKEHLTGRILAYACMRLETRYKHKVFPDGFINWLYYY